MKLAGISVHCCDTNTIW